MLVRRGDLAGADAEYRRAIEMLAIGAALAVDPTYGIAIGLRRRVLAAMRPRSRWWRR